MQPLKPQVSIILEWENALLSELGRTRTMLQRVRLQIEQAGLASEFIVLFNPEQIDRDMIATELDAAFAGSDINYRIEAAHGLHYYDLKNHGAKLAAGDIIVFVDSDVIPEEGWLRNILQPLLSDASASVVAGTSYIDPIGFVGKAFALSWLFPLRSEFDRVDKNAKSFHANNIAFRREFFLAHPFPSMPHGVTRGACGQLAASLKAQGFAIYRQHAARVSHPPPNGFRHTVVRAIAEGRDIAFRISGDQGRVGRLIGVLRKFIRKIFNRALFRVLRDHGKVGMPAWQVPAAVIMMTGYYLLAMAGGIMTVFMPGYMADRFRI